MRPLTGMIRALLIGGFVFSLAGCGLAQTTVPQQAQKPADNPAAQKPARNLAEKAADKPKDKPVVKPIEKPVDKPVEKPVESAAKPASKPEASPIASNGQEAPSEAPKAADAVKSQAPAQQAKTPLADGSWQYPTVKHVVIVVEENHSYNQIVGNSKAPYMNTLIQQGALFTDAHGITHPSQPNYLAIFSGSTQGVKDDSCGKPFEAPNLASELLQKKLTFIGYSEDLPKAGFTGCWAGSYGRKHNPWVQFENVPEDLNQPLSAWPKDFSKLPSVSFVIPNHQNDMHDGTVEEADTWLKKHLDDYVKWAQTHDSLLIVTWDEDDFSPSNRIPTIFAGPMVKPGKYAETINHYHVLRTVEELFGLKPLGGSAKADPLRSVWKDGKV